MVTSARRFARLGVLISVNLYSRRPNAFGPGGYGEIVHASAGSEFDFFALDSSAALPGEPVFSVSPDQSERIT